MSNNSEELVPTPLRTEPLAIDESDLDDMAAPSVGETELQATPVSSVEEPSPPKEKSYSVLNFIIELPILIAVAFIIAFLIKTYVIQPFYIPSGSMEPTLMVNDRVLVLKFTKYFEDYNKSNILVFVSPTDGKRDFIKRTIAKAGDTIEVKAGRVFINGKMIEEPYLPEGFTTTGEYGPYKVPEGSLFMMGDNRNHSQDSRVFGAVKEDTIVGKAFIVYWPLDRIGLIGR